MLEKNKIYNGDCLEIMKSIDDKSIDMILCDLPYGTTACKWDVIIPFESLWEQYKRIIKDNGAIVLTASQPFTTDLINSNRAMFKYEIIWNKLSNSGFALCNKQPMKAHENILLFYKKQPTYNPLKTKREKEKLYKQEIMESGITNINIKRTNFLLTESFPTSILTIGSQSAECNNVNREHPTQKPVALFEYLIKTYTNENETILDNCSGSGTTAIACINTNRNYICIEKDKTYFDKSVERIEKHLSQTNMFRKVI